MNRMEILKVSGKSDPNKVAGAIADAIKTYNEVDIQVIGASALNQAIKAICVAKGYVAPGGINLICSPSFVIVNIDGYEKTAIKLTVKGE